MAGIREQDAYDAVREPLLLMGVYFQAQDDYLDAFAPPETLGKIGTDIQEGEKMPGMDGRPNLGMVYGVWPLGLWMFITRDQEPPKIEVAGDF